MKAEPVRSYVQTPQHHQAQPNRFHQVSVIIADSLRIAEQRQIIEVPEAFTTPKQFQLGGNQSEPFHDRKLIRNPDFIKMCVLYPRLGRDREAARVAFHAYRGVSQEEERLIQTNEYARALRAYFMFLYEQNPLGQEIEVTPFVQCVFVPGLEGVRKNGESYAVVACGDDLCKNSFFLRKKLACRDKQALWRLGLTLAYFGQQLLGF